MSLEQLPDPIKNHIIESTVRDYPPRRDNDLYVTELLGCLRKAYLRRRLPDKPKKCKDAWPLYRGNLLDYKLTSLFDRNQVRVTYRIPQSSIVISGKCDFIHEDIVYDLKTVKTLFYIKKPREDHIEQVEFYAYNLALDDGALIYMDFGDARIFKIDCIDALETVEDISVSARILYDHLCRNEPPPAKEEPDWECDYCEHSKECEEMK